MIPTATELLNRLDAQRPRTMQTEMGMSSLGACRRQAAYHSQGYPADPEFADNGIQAMLGTAVHEALAQAARLFIPGAMAENIEVGFAGLKGHPDLYVDSTVRDYKTLGFGIQLEARRSFGPPQRDRWQVHTYGAGLVLRGYPVHTVQIDYIDRGSGEEYLFEEPFSLDVVEEAVRWLRDIRDTPVHVQPRDFRPDSGTCLHCQFFRRCWQAEPPTDDRHVLFVEDPDAAKWAQRLLDARERAKLASADEADAKGALDHLRSVQKPGEHEDIAVPELDKVIRFTMKRGRQTPDMPQIAMDYKRAGARPPMRTGEPTVSLTLVKPRKAKADG